MPPAREFVALSCCRPARSRAANLLQAFVYGATIVAIEGNFDDALRLVRKLGERSDFAIVNSINPDRIAGQTTAAFEIVDVLGDAPARSSSASRQRRKHHGLLGRVPRITTSAENQRGCPR